MQKTQRIFLDNAAGTAVDERVLEAMAPYWQDEVGNAGALHKEGRTAHEAVERARTIVAQVLTAHPDEITFSSGSTEANNLAVLGLVRAQLSAGTPATKLHIITSVIEHSSVRECFEAFEKMGVNVSYVPVDSVGKVNIDALHTLLRPETVLVSIMHVNNEIGAIEDLPAIVRVLADWRKQHTSPWPLFHTDASQSPAWLPLTVRSLGVDLLTLDSQKLYGPRGVGCLYKRRGVELEPVLYGGKQEDGLRPGTPPTPLIVGFAEALRLVEEERESYVTNVAGLADTFLRAVTDALPDAVLNGPKGGSRLPNNINLSFPGLDAEQIVLELDARGVAASTRSACLFANEPGSYVVASLGDDNARATSAVRFSLSRHTTQEDIEQAAKVLIEVVQWLTKTTNGR